MAKTLALILAGGRGTRLDILSAHRAKPSVPFAGKFRLIDFSLSNCVNSGIYNVGVLTQYLPLSLNNHIGIGKPWDLDRKMGGLTILQPFKGKSGKTDWYEGTAHAVYKNLSFIRSNNPDDIIILSGDHIYKMDYAKMIEHHRQKGADLTIAAQPVPYENASRFGILDYQDDKKITDFIEKPKDPPSNLASMGIYVFKKDILLEVLNEYCSQKDSDFGHHIIPPMIDENEVFVYEYNGYWQDVGTLDSYYQTHLDLIEPVPQLNLYDKDWKIYTRDTVLSPVKFGNKGNAQKSLISNGAIINGQVKNSIISPGVHIKEGAVIKDSIIFNDSIIHENSIIEKSIIDKEAEVMPECRIGVGDDMTPNQQKPDLVNNGLNIIAKRATIPEGSTIKRNCRILSYADIDDFDDKIIPSGKTITSEVGQKITYGDEELVRKINV